MKKSPKTLVKISLLQRGNSILTDQSATAIMPCILLKIPYMSWFKFKRQLEIVSNERIFIYNFKKMMCENWKHKNEFWNTENNN